MSELVSIHGGHSGQFCLHAQDRLEEIILAYIDRGFSWVGITEHAPPEREELMYDDQRQAGSTVEQLYVDFAAYMQECRRLKEKYSDRITIFAAMESESCGNYQQYIPRLVTSFQPEYIVGSVHHVLEVNFDYSPAHYLQAVEKARGLTRLYARYFDLQYEMIAAIKPSVIGHFDLIRIFDRNYRQQWRQPEVWRRIVRNLELIEKLGLILDYNQRAVVKGASEPYISRPILALAREMNIAVVPGDDSHSVATVGCFIREAAATLGEMGFTGVWKKPV